MPSRKTSASSSSGSSADTGVIVERAADVLTFILNNPAHGNEVTGAMFDAMLAELRVESSRPARVRKECTKGTLMNPNPTITISNSAPPHCQQRSPSGRRCRMPIADPGSGLCFKHAAAQKKDRDAANLAATLIGDTQEFTSAVTINRSLGELYKLLARDEIAPRRAAVMAYTGSLLLRTLPAIERELQIEEGPPQLDFSDWPGNERRHPERYQVGFGDLPRPER
jgi:hypothetical protein